MPRSLATRISAAATSRTWLTLPGDAVDLGAGDGLHRVDDEQVGLDRVDVAEHGRQVGLGGQEEVVAQGADALGPQPHLGGRLLTGDVERAAALGEPRGHVEQQGRLADARLAGEQHDGARHQAAAEHPVELVDAGRDGAGPPRRRPRRSAGPARTPARPSVVRTVGAETSSTVPHAWHSPHRPTHLPTVQPHSAQR